MHAGQSMRSYLIWSNQWPIRYQHSLLVFVYYKQKQQQQEKKKKEEEKIDRLYDYYYLLWFIYHDTLKTED